MTRSYPNAVEIRGLAKHYGRVRALKAVDLEIRSGLYFALLGPSGGGKTTLLRAIGGFIKPNAGRVLLNGEDVTALPPERRPTSMVFQSYALFPHMTVARNVGYGLELRKLPRAAIAVQVEAALAQVSLSGYGERRVWELSGGQQQRVQLARALVLKPSILLLDEPLAALDAKLRKDMCYELKHLQEAVGITFVHVTHNQEEAMTVADRIAIIADGELVEEGTPREIYETPARRFTAEFVGENNLFNGRVASVSGSAVRVRTPAGDIAATARGTAPTIDAEVAVSVRSESVRLAAQGSPGLAASYRERVYLGLTTQHVVTLPDGAELTTRAVSDEAGDAGWSPGDAVVVQWNPEDARLHLD